MFKKIKNYFIEDAIVEQKTVLDRVKIYTLYSIIVFHTIVYILGSIAIFSGDYPLVQLLQIIGFSFIVAIAITLKHTKNYKTPGIIWMIGGIVYTLFATIISQGESSYISFAAMILNILVSFLVLDRTLLVINLIYYTILFLITVSILYGYLPKLDFGLNLSRELDFLDQSNLIPIILVVLMISYIVKVYSSSHQKAIEKILKQQENAIKDQELIAAKSLSIDNSIDYAVEIQNSILSQSEKFDPYFRSYFTFFKPKDKLSGDLYWIHEKDDQIYFALIDTETDGVSGAILSIICQNGLRKAVQELNLSSPSAILDYLNHYVEKTLTIGDQQNEMDVTICSFHKEDNKLFYAGANCPIYILRNSKIIEFEPNKESIGKYSKGTIFKNTEIQLLVNDVLYLFTDGYANQPGGENAEKLNINAFKDLLISTANADLADQKNSLAGAFDDWKGKNEQLDDICVIGLKI